MTPSTVDLVHHLEVTLDLELFGSMPTMSLNNRSTSWLEDNANRGWEMLY